MISDDFLAFLDFISFLLIFLLFFFDELFEFFHSFVDVFVLLVKVLHCHFVFSFHSLFGSTVSLFRMLVLQGNTGVTVVGLHVDSVLD